MSNRQHDEEAVFQIARKLGPDDRPAYLDQVCAGDMALRERVEALLKVHEQEQSFLKSTPDRGEETQDHRPALERPGDKIGRYQLREQLGEGGMGTVFVAEQQRPIRRKVAIKVIKPGMDSKSVIARFEAERQALAMMDHPNIAKVLDAGATDSGRPYFAMELVKGIPITKYCDDNRLTVNDRLALFQHVCHAVQHAHQKGIIHRDIKPGNVLVALHDGKPVPKVIDFGVAKAISARLTDETVYTEHYQIVGTWLYMSPEQAELSNLDVDTRSDIYSLGVLLYELLTGTTPFTKAELDKAGFDEQRRIILEKQPPRASVRISSLGDTATTIADRRKTDPRRLNALLTDDLDWIVLKALEKDRTRRYESPNALAADIERHLAHQPIIARRPSWVYRLAKLARRRPASVLIVALLALLLGTGFVSLFALVGLQSARLETQRQRAQAKVVLEGTADVIVNTCMNKAVEAYQAEQNLDMALEYTDLAIDCFTELVDVAPQVDRNKFIYSLYAMHGMRGQFCRESGRKEEAAREFQKVQDLGPKIDPNGPFSLEMRGMAALGANDLALLVEELESPARALKIVDRAMQNLPSDLSSLSPDTEERGAWFKLSLTRAKLLRRSGRLDHAVDELERTTSLAASNTKVYPPSGTQLIDVADGYVRIASISDESRRGAILTKAIESLQLAVKLGFDNVDAIQTDDRLSELQDDPRFKQLIHRQPHAKESGQ